MEKIVIINDDQKVTDLMVECLGILFPECDIHIRSKDEKAYDKYQTTGEFEPNQVIEKY